VLVFLTLLHSFTEIDETPYAFLTDAMLKYSSAAESCR
jgi:hypothetical protein